jgi:hypothetical protein
MKLTDTIHEILQADIPTSFARFGRVLDAQWIEDALTETGTASIRKRKLPAQVIVWLVIGMALFRDRSINEVISHLGLVFQPKKNPCAGSKTIVPSAIPQARYHVGPDPLKLIFERTAKTWAAADAEANRWRGLSLFGIDGTTLRVSDTDDNREAFGLPGTGQGQASYPQVRLVALMALRSHAIYAVVFGPYSGKKNGEHSLATELWSQVPDQSLIIMDRGFIDYGLFYRLSHGDNGTVTEQRHWLVRAKKNLCWKLIQRLGPNDELVELTLSPVARHKDPGLPKTMIVRAIRYQIKGFQPQVLLTSLIDSNLYPATEIVDLYHERWEIELGYDEIKTHMLEREESLRSKKSEGVRQEIWGILLAYNLVRKEMLDVAQTAGVSPLQVSFRHSLQLIRIFCMVEAWTCAPGNLPKRLSSHLEMMASLLILPERRPDRYYKRHVKIQKSPYERNPGRPVANGSK